MEGVVYLESRPVRLLRIDISQTVQRRGIQQFISLGIIVHSSICISDLARVGKATISGATCFRTGRKKTHQRIAEPCEQPGSRSALWIVYKERREERGQIPDRRQF